MTDENPVLFPSALAHRNDDYSQDEVLLANRNSGTLLETLRHDITPIGAHYLLNHFDVPYVTKHEARNWTLSIFNGDSDLVSIPVSDITQLQKVVRPVTLECAGNGRAHMAPRWPTQPWFSEAVGTASWEGTPFKNIIKNMTIDSSICEVVFYGRDRGVSSGDVHRYGRSLPIAEAMSDDVMLVWGMNGQELPPQHGYPLRLIVPGWYGMASVKWLDTIEFVTKPFTGHQQTVYSLRSEKHETPVPITKMQVRALMTPPGIAEWASSRRLVETTTTKITGKAWSGSGIGIATVEFSDNGVWKQAKLDAPIGNFAWRGWSVDWTPTVGRHILSCRAIDELDNVQPVVAEWNHGGFCNNEPQVVEAWGVDSFNCS